MIWAIIAWVILAGPILCVVAGVLLGVLAPHKVRAWDKALNGPGKQGLGHGLRHPFILGHQLRYGEKGNQYGKH